MFSFEGKTGFGMVEFFGLPVGGVVTTKAICQSIAVELTLMVVLMASRTLLTETAETLHGLGGILAAEVTGPARGSLVPALQGIRCEVMIEAD